MLTDKLKNTDKPFKATSLMMTRTEGAIILLVWVFSEAELDGRWFPVWQLCKPHSFSQGCFQHTHGSTSLINWQFCHERGFLWYTRTSWVDCTIFTTWRSKISILKVFRMRKCTHTCARNPCRKQSEHCSAAGWRGTTKTALGQEENSSHAILCALLLFSLLLFF